MAGGMKTRILVTGSNGLLGNRLVEHLRNRGEVELLATSRGADRREDRAGYGYLPLDVTQEDAIQEVFQQFRPDAIIHTAACTQVEVAEAQPAECRLLNVGAVDYLIRACNRWGGHLVFLSTDFVFNGMDGPYSEEDGLSPISTYGRSKAAAEKLLRDSGISWAIVRTILVYGKKVPEGRQNILHWAEKALRSGQPIRVVNDQYRMPTLDEDLAWACTEIALKRATGVFHICGPDGVTIHELVCRVAGHLGLGTEGIEPVPSRALAHAELRPLRTGFYTRRAQAQLGFVATSLNQGLAAVLGPASVTSELKSMDVEPNVPVQPSGFGNAAFNEYV